MNRGGAPAIATMPSQIAPKTIAVPMSGSIRTSTAGTPAITSEVTNIRGSFILACLSAR